MLIIQFNTYLLHILLFNIYSYLEIFFYINIYRCDIYNTIYQDVLLVQQFIYIDVFICMMVDIGT